ncbi:MAG: exodeoxyribonuclease VII large subunit [Firmicutes bacterium]|nr:exodeoxyribonuclease VII large subunit [Bacillota bacterium]
MEKKLTVSQLNKYIKGVFEDELILHGISVEGEVFEIKSAAGNTYIVLNEGDSSLNCVCFSNNIALEAGAKIVAYGSVEFYHKSGRVSFIIKSFKICGQGELLYKIKKTKEKLKNEGIFDNNRPFKSFIKTVALVTSDSGAVKHDFISVLNRLAPYVDIKIFASKVQGAGAAALIADIIGDINSPINTNNASDKTDFDIDHIDCVVIARGGGSDLDLNEFNDENLARAVFASKIQVVSAVGHESDYTLCDFAADIRAGTPSIAAEMIALNNKTFLNNFFSLFKLCQKNAENLIFQNSKKLKKISVSNSIKSENIINLSHKLIKKHINNSYQNLIKKINLSLNKTALTRQSFAKLLSNVSTKESKLKIICAKTDELSPLKILSKGYAKIQKNKKDISLAADLSSGDSIDIVLSDGFKKAQIK